MHRGLAQDVVTVPYQTTWQLATLFKARKAFRQRCGRCASSPNNLFIAGAARRALRGCLLIDACKLADLDTYLQRHMYSPTILHTCQVPHI